MGCGCSTFETTITKIVNHKQTAFTQITENNNDNNNIINLKINSKQKNTNNNVVTTENNNHPFAFPTITPTLIEIEKYDKTKDIGVSMIHRQIDEPETPKPKKETKFIQKIKQSRMMNLLTVYIEAKTGLAQFSSEKDTALIAKSLSPICLDNKILDCINFNVKNIKKTYKHQPYPEEGTKFIDEYFPPNADSLLGMKNSVPVDKISSRLEKLQKEFMFDSSNIVWLSAEEIFNSKFSIFVDDISIDDVRQGNLGNCYFMSSLAAMTTIPQLICQLFRSFKIPDNNCYEIGMNINGEWKIVLLDDYFPCSKKNRVPIFAKPNGPELWAMLIEKAWAKINGGYLNITGGWASEVLSALTSFPIETIKLNVINMDTIWNNLNSAFKAGQIISCCSNFNKEIEKYGLISGHSFTITKFSHGNVSDKQIRLIKLRNPWGYREWNGPWSDHSPLWTDEAKHQLSANLVVSDDGEFWMSFEDFFRFFCFVDICKVTNPQCVQTIQITKDRLAYPNVFEMQIFSKTIIIITLNKKYYRYHRSLLSEQDLTVNVIVVKKGKNNSLELVSSTHKTDGNPTIELELSVGFFLIYVHCNYPYSNYDKVRKVRLYVSSKKYFFLYEKGVDYDYSLLRMIMSHSLQKALDKEDKHNMLPLVTGNKFESTTFGYLAIKNNSSISMKYMIHNQSQNFQLFLPFDKKHNCKQYITLPPGKTAVFAGIRQQYYEVYKFTLDVVKNISQFASEYCDDMLFIQHFNENCPIKEINENEYDFYFKSMKVDTYKISEAIDYRANAEEYFTKKYPKEMGMIVKEVAPVNDGELLIFRDVFDFGDSYYIGEWKIKEELTKHGRGLLVYSDGSSYLGQFVNDKMEGKGKLFCNTVESIDITWKDGKMDGLGVLSRIDGTFKKVFYQDGKLIC